MKKLGIGLSILLVLLSGIIPGKAFAAEAETVSIPVRILAAGAVPEGGTDAEVELSAQTPGAPMPEGSNAGVFRLKLKNGSTGYLRIPCGALGVFDYAIRQIPGSDPGCTYDGREYRLRLYVTAREDGGISVSALLYGQEGTKETEVSFRNHWAEPAYVTVSARKTMDGSTPKDGASTFRLLTEDGEVVDEVKNDGRHVVFPSLRFDREGTFRFFLKEVAGKDRKILYDRAVYTITVVVTKDVDYQTQVTYERNGKPWSGTPSFANYTDTGSPKTGDTIGIWFGVLALSAAALGSLLIFRRRKQ